MEYNGIPNIQKYLLEWASTSLRKFPWRKKKMSPYEIFVAEILLKRTTAKAASGIYGKFLKKYSTIKKLASSDTDELDEIVRPIGYWQRALEARMAAKYIVEYLGSKFPNDKDVLLEIPFVGDYISSAILSLAFDRPYPMVDSNVNRIISRVYFGTSPTSNIKKDVQKVAHLVLPRDHHRIFNLAMIDLGGTVCLSKNPKCHICPLGEICKYKNKKV